MVDTVIKSFDIWTASQTIKSNGRTISVENQKLFGIDKLRELILELAVRGKLVSQVEKDEPAIKLLEKISGEKVKLVEKGTIKKQESLSKIVETEKLFEISKNWAWTKLGQISANIHYGYTASANAGISEVRLLRITDIQNNCVNWESVPGCEIKESEIKDYRLENGDILIARTGGTIGKSYLVQDINVCAVFASYLIRVKHVEPMNSKFIKVFLGSPFYWKQLFNNSMGTGQPNVNGNALKNLIIPLPPLAEQHRIVAKVDELIALCDQLEQQQTQSNAAHQQLVELLLQNLTEAGSPEAFEAAWQRIAINFDILFTTEYSIDQLKQTILQLAVMGKLVPQDPKDEPASEVIKKINLDKIQNLIGFPELIDSELPYKIPNTWAWTIVGKCFELKSGTTFENTREQNIGHFMYLKVADLNLIGNEVNITTSSRYLNPTEKEKNALIPAGSIVFPKRGGAIATNKKKLVKTDVFVDLNIMALTPFKGINLDYAYAWLKGLDLAKLNSGTSVPQINNKDIAPLFFPLPPLAEQHRIVAKVDELFALCDALKARIKEAQETQGVLAEGVVEGVLG